MNGQVCRVRVKGEWKQALCRILGTPGQTRLDLSGKICCVLTNKRNLKINKVSRTQLLVAGEVGGGSIYANEGYGGTRKSLCLHQRKSLPGKQSEDRDMVCGINK